MLIELKAAVRDLRAAVAECRCNMGTAALEETSGLLGDILPEPLSTCEEWEELESKLEDNSTRRNLADRLAVLGGANLDDVVRVIMETCTKKSLQQKITVEGRNGKRSFKGTRLFDCVLTAVHKRMDTLKVPVTDKEITARVGRYLTCAGDREGGRKQRAVRH
ncbi:uncharacterized protein LOC135387330 [Ornithodoros turicata]|uniref:uncharacterized protein LOC135368976 n=1 Tax=Ornithodoros turicata TaxID=34597 RepID=UPI00313973C7